MNMMIRTPLRGGEIEAIPSKSQAHRLLICAALADRPTRVECACVSQDILATADCLRELGAGIRLEGGAFEVQPVGAVQSGGTLRCRESGSTLRFLLPVAAALGAECRFALEGRLAQRPQGPLLDILRSGGCTVTSSEPDCLALRGRLQSGDFTVPGDVSSQFVSGMLMALPLLEKGGTVRVSGGLQSRPYVDMTLDALRLFSVPVCSREQVFSIAGQAAFRSPGPVSVEGDWSNAAFWLCAGALCEQKITCKGIALSSAQGDRKIVDILRRMGAQIEVFDGGVSAARGSLHGVEIDASDIPDLVPVLAAVAAMAQGQTRIYNAGRLRLKESDRLHTVTQALTALGADVCEQSDALLITGRTSLHGGTVDACGDHRIAMTAAVAAVAASGPVMVLGAQAVDKSYPAFWQHYARLGGQTEEC